MDERSHGVGAERGERQGLGQRMCGYRPQQHPVRRVAVVRPVGNQHAGAKSLQPSRQEVDEAQRGGIDPVRIVDHQQHRGPLGQLGDMECQSSQQLRVPPPRRLGGAPARLLPAGRSRHATRSCAPGSRRAPYERISRPGGLARLRRPAAGTCRPPPLPRSPATRRVRSSPPPADPPPFRAPNRAPGGPVRVSARSSTKSRVDPQRHPPV